MAVGEYPPTVLLCWPKCLQALLLVVTAILSCCCLSTSDDWKSQLHETGSATAYDAHHSAGSTTHSTLQSSLQNYSSSTSSIRHKTENAPNTLLSTLQCHRNCNNNSSSNSSSNNTLDSGYRADNLSQQLVWLQKVGLCPGAADVLVQRAVQQVLRVAVSDCWHLPHVLWSKRAVLYGVCSNTSSFCRFPVQAPRGKAVHVSIRTLLSIDGKHQWRTGVHDSLSGKGSWPETVYSTMSGVKREFLSTTNQVYVSHQNKPPLRMYFAVYNQSFDIVYTATHSGYATLSLPTHGYSWKEPELYSQLEVSPGHIAMVSFETFHSRNPSCLRYVELGFQEPGKSRGSVSRILSDTERSVVILHTAQIHIHARLRQKRSNISCLKMIFSFHPKNQAPQRSSEGLFNCSTKDYSSFQQHLHCNARLQCEDGRDETAQCPFSSAACSGLVASGHKCYLYVSMSSKLTPEGAMSECFARGMHLASISSEQELRDFENLFRNQDVEDIFTALASGWSSLPWMYTQFFYWSGSTVIYFLNHLTIDLILWLQNSRVHEQYAYMKESPHKSSMHGLERRSHHFVCEQYLQAKETSAKPIEPLPVPNITQVWQELVFCPDGYMTHAFLSCDHKSQCHSMPCVFVNHTSSVASVQPVQRVALFTCSREAAPISYSLVCDFRADCPDQSDESFCQHPPCYGFLCAVGQCVPETEECDGYSDCLDDSDERECYDYDEGKKIESRAKAQPYLFNFDGRGYFIYEEMNKSDSCPVTHYRCTTEHTDCLPVYTRCNGVYDCMYHEDEKDCDSFRCPGFFHCRDSTVCVHAEHLCDGWPQCPQRDDEWLCNQTCPTECLCQGLAFLCPQPFQAGLFPQLRSLDACQSGMTPLDMANNTYLVHLSLAHCSIRNLSSHVQFPNLQIIDLSHNKLSMLMMNVFVGMRNLRHLSLKDNPLVSLSRGSSNLEQHLLIRLDLSLTYLEDFSSETVSNFRDIQDINLSFSNLRTIGPKGFQASSHLKQLDIRGNAISEFPQDLFEGLGELKMVYSSNYRMCCDSVLPYSAREIICLAPEQIISSCKYLLFLDSHRLWFWLVSILSTTGNILCLIGILVLKKTPRNAFSVLVGNLHCSLVLTGAYAGVITTAHEMFHGQYLQHEKTWTKSSFCKGAGFMSLLSSETSILTLCLLTLDQVMCVCFPSSPYRLNKRSAAGTCAVAWLVGLMLASAPLLQGSSHCGRYGQTAVCGLMLHSPRCSGAPGHFFLATVMFNCVACLWLCGGLLSVRRNLPRHRVLTDPSQRIVRATAGLCSKLTVSQAASCLSITATTVTSMGGQAESQEGEVIMAVFVWPLSAALTPLLSLWNALSDRRRQEQEDRLLRVLKARLKSDRALT